MMSVGCDDENFSSPKSFQGGSCLSLDFRPFAFTAKADASGVDLKVRPANVVSKRSAEKKLQIDILRASLITPPPYGHPLYKQRGSLYSANNQ